MKKLLVVLLLLFASAAWAADVNVVRNPNASPLLESCSSTFQGHVLGKIEKGDAEKFKIAMERTILQNKGSCTDGFFTIHVHSQGGDVEEAIKLGRLMRKYNIKTVVSIPSECSSACVFVLAGGVRRWALGKVGIHRPYFANLDSRLTINEIRKQRDEFNSKIIDYLKEVDIPLSLFDAMNAISPESNKYLTDVEKDQFQLNGEDATFDEYQTAQNAKFFGITSGEYRRRFDRADTVCKNLGLTGGSDCRNAIMLGLDIPTFRSRQARSRLVCGKSDVQCFGRLWRGE